MKSRGVVGAVVGWFTERSAAGRRRSVRAAVQKFVRQYAAAVYNRLTSDWVTLGTSADAEMYTSLRTLRSRSRQQVRDNDYAKRAKRIIENNVIGTGIRFQSQVMMQRKPMLDANVNGQIETLWQRWSRKQNCDVAGQLSLSQMQIVLMGAIFESGEVYVRKVKQNGFGESVIPFALEVIEADQIVDDWNGKADNGNEVRMGIEVDKWHRPVAYWMYPKHPGDFSFQYGQVPSNRYVRVPAEEIYHLFLTDRPGATRGVPWMHSALKRLNHLAGYEEAELVAMRASSAMMGFIQSQEIGDPALDTSGEFGADAVQDGQRVYDFEPGTIKELAPGETFSGWNPGRQNGANEAYMRSQLRGASAGIGVSYESLSKDYSQSNYSSSRLSMLDDRDFFKVIQQFMMENFMQPLYEDFLDMSVLSGRLPFPDYELNPLRYKESARWMARGWEWIDPWKEVQAAKLAIRSGLATAQSVLSSKGDDVEELFKQLRRERDLASQYNLVLETDAAQTTDKGEVQALPPIEEDDQSTPADPTDEGDGSSEESTTDDAAD